MNLPEFQNTSHARAFGLTATPEIIKQLKWRRQMFLDYAQKLSGQNYLNAAVRELIKAQFDREAVESYQEKIKA